jgi:tetratricopeptide (TPR) repeat protein
LNQLPIDLSMKSYIAFFLFLFVAVFPAAASTPPDFGSKFLEANQLMEEKFWDQAIKQWKEILESHPDNANINYKLGYTLLQTVSNKTEALHYLEVATSKKISKSYDPYDPMERRAPADAWFYLGNAQHLNYDMDGAIGSYQKYMKYISKKNQMYARTEREIGKCEEAKRQVANPKTYGITNVGPIINGPENDFSPVLSIDESSMFFTSSRMRPDSSNSRIIDFATQEFKEDVYVSFKDAENQWTSPELLNLNSDDHDATISVSPDGQTLFIYRDSLEDGRILYSKLIGETWSDPAKLGSDINTDAWETHATISADGNTLYFVSNRAGGYGGRDIYKCVKLPNGEWSRSLNIGPVINTKEEEDSPFLTADGKTMYFASRGHDNMGSFDIFSSHLGADGEWTKPENLGYPLNTVDDDSFFQPMADGRRAYYTSEKDGGYGKKDIYLVDLPKEISESSVAVLKGFIIGEDGKDLPPDLKVIVTNLKNNEKSEYRPRMRDGGFLAVLSPCTNYEIEYFIGLERIKQDAISIPCENVFMEIEREVFIIQTAPTASPTPEPAPVVEPKKEDPKKSEPKREDPKKVEPKKEEPKKEEPKKEEEPVIAPIKEKGEDSSLTLTEPVDLTYDPKDPIKIQFFENLGYAEFSRFFVYDFTDFGKTEVKFQVFVKNVKKIIEKKGPVKITVESSASNVPSSRFKTNIELSTWRNKAAEDQVRGEMIKMGFVEGKDYEFGEPVKLVQGKKYENDAQKNRTMYEPNQYIKIRCEMKK